MHCCSLRRLETRISLRDVWEREREKKNHTLFFWVSFTELSIVFWKLNIYTSCTHIHNSKFCEIFRGFLVLEVRKDEDAIFSFSSCFNSSHTFHFILHTFFLFVADCLHKLVVIPTNNSLTCSLCTDIFLWVFVQINCGENYFDWNICRLCIFI